MHNTMKRYMKVFSYFSVIRKSLVPWCQSQPAYIVVYLFSTSFKLVVMSEPTPSTSSEGVAAKRARYAHEYKSMWSFHKIKPRLATREQGLAFAEDRGLLLKTKNCSRHKKPMLLEIKYGAVGTFICCKGICRDKSRRSRSIGTWFENAKISIPRIYHLMYCYANNLDYITTIKEDLNDSENCLSPTTICDWFNYCRETVVLYQMNKEEHLGKIGGPGKIVRIIESKFGKRKCNEGRHIEGYWVIGIIADGSQDLRMEVCSDDVHSAEVLVLLIKKHVVEGTTIHTSFQWAYDCLCDHGFISQNDNHSVPGRPLVAPDCTRTESQYNGIIQRFFNKDNHNNVENYADLIVEYIWRTEITKTRKDPFEELIKAIKYVYGPKR